MHCHSPGAKRDHLSVTALSISEKVRSRIPPGPDRYDKNEKLDEIYRDWSRADGSAGDANYDRVLFLVYELYKPRIVSIAKSYRSLSPVFDDDDLLQTGLLGILQALVKFDHAEHIAMKFSTYLEWSVRNVFQRAIGSGDKFVEIYDASDRFICAMGYQDFLAKKKELLSRGCTYTVKSRHCYIADENNEAALCLSALSHMRTTDICEHLEAV